MRQHESLDFISTSSSSSDYVPLPATIEDVFRADLDLHIRLKVLSPSDATGATLNISN